MRKFIFDLDGTLLNTLTDIGNACNYTLKEYGYKQYPISQYSIFVGNGFETLIKRCLGNWDEIPEFQEIVTTARKRYADYLIDATKPYEGMAETLKNLYEQSVTLAVLSNKPDKLTKELIGHFFPEISFSHVLGGRENVPLKPDSAVLNEIIGETEKDHCYYIGDSDVDMLTARNARCHAIGVAWGFRGEQELKAAGAEKIVLKPLDLIMI